MEGDRQSVDSLLPIVYQELRRLAASYLRRERPGQTLQPTALVHEAYMRLMKDKPGRWQNRAHFCAIAAHSMRQILIERARARGAQKRGGARQRVTRTRALDQDLPHGVRRDRAEVRAVLPTLRAILQELHVRFVDERRRLQRLPGALPLQIMRGEAPQLGVHERHERFERGPVATRGAIDQHVERRPLAHQAVRSIDTLLITTGVTGRS